MRELLLAELLKGFSRNNEIRTQTFLGDRSDYIGLSDVGKAFGCLRSAVASKVCVSDFYPEPSAVDEMCRTAADQDSAFLLLKERFSKVLTLDRGHWQEAGLSEALSALGAPALEQLEISIEHQNVPIKAHLDFTLLTPTQIIVLESKSMASIPTDPYGSQEVQLQGQIGLLHEFWNQPVFSVRNDRGSLVCENMTFPQVAKQIFGRDYPHEPLPIYGFLLAISMSEIEPFGPFCPSEFWTGAVKDKAVELWTTWKKVENGELSLDDIPTARGFYPLCDYCIAGKGCPKYRVEDRRPEYLQLVEELKSLEDEKKSIQNEIEARKEMLMTAYEESGCSGSAYVDVGPFEFRSAKQTRSTINRAKLEEALRGRGWNEDAIYILIEDSASSSEFIRLFIRKTKPAPTRKKKAA